MKTIELNEQLRRGINQYLRNNYGMTLPLSQKYVYDERKEYLYIDADNERFFYIPKTEVNTD